MKIKSIIFFSNGNTAVFNEKDEQVPQLQNGWFRTFITELRHKDFDLSNTEILMPDRRTAKIIELDGDNFNWHIK